MYLGREALKLGSDLLAMLNFGISLTKGEKEEKKSSTVGMQLFFSAVECYSVNPSFA
jgi:hypothetical protein